MMNPPWRVSRAHNLPRLLAAALLLLLAFAPAAQAQDADLDRHPLRPPNTSSPRATLTSFLTALNDAYAAAQRDEPVEVVLTSMGRAKRSLDLSRVPPRLAADVGAENAFLLKEVLDRIELPLPASIPGTDEVEHAGLTRWTVPNTEITLAKVTEGSRTGEFLFDAETVARAREYYRRTRHLPYKLGATPEIYKAYILTPGPAIDPYWQNVFPGWASFVILDQAVWQWIGMVLVLLVAAVLVVVVYRWGRDWDERRHEDAVFKVGRILAVAFAVVVVSLTDNLTDRQINITGNVLHVKKLSLTLLFYGLVGWLVALVGNGIPEAIIASRRLRPRGVDSQLLRLGFRLILFSALAALLMRAASQLGLPAYSVVTGLGVGGLAVALAARETLANFLGSITIMWDRPYRIGDWIVVGEQEGMVEDIGFRSTRIRTFYDSLLSIPNSDTVNAAVDNMGRRKYRRIRSFVSITYDTPAEKIEAFLEGIKNILLANPTTRKDYFNVVLHELGAHSLEIMLYFFLKVPGYPGELIERQRIFLEIIRLAEAMEVRMAFPTQTLHVESLPESQLAGPTREPAGEQLEKIAREFGPDGGRSRPRGSGAFTPLHEDDSMKTP